MSVLVDGVVGEFEFLEGDGRLPSELIASERRVGVAVKTSRWCRVRHASHDPRRTVIGVPACTHSVAAGHAWNQLM